MGLLERFAAGDVDAFEELFRGFQGLVYGSIVRIVRDPAAAEELTLEAFWRIYRARARFDPARSFAPWARRIATRIAIDHLKAARPELPLPCSRWWQLGSRCTRSTPWRCSITSEEAEMTSHPYLRAYLAGIALPTAFLLVLLCALVAAHLGGGLPAVVERFLVFPMAVVPNLWGLWNMIHVALRRSGAGWPLGLHGAALPLLLLPAGVLLNQLLRVELYTPLRVLLVLPVVLIVYYVAWKHGVGFLNRLLGVTP